MKTVKGIWTFNDVPSNVEVYELVNFTSAGSDYVAIAIDTNSIGTLALAYGLGDYDENGELIDIEWGDAVYCYEPNSDYNREIGWKDEAYKTIDFGKTEQEVSDFLYAWLTENTIPRNIEFDITENGKTTLATAGKYCDRNIDIIVDVAGTGGGSDIVYDADALAQGTISGDYVSNKITSLKPYAFSYCRDLVNVSLPNCTTFRAEKENNGSHFRYTENLKTINLPNLTTIEKATYSFNWCSHLKEFYAPNLISLTQTTAMFSQCSELRKVILPNLGGMAISGSTFSRCYKLEVLVLGGDTVNPLENVNALSDAGSNVENGLSIYVPDNLVGAYKQATNWSTFADKIKPMSEWEG